MIHNSYVIAYRVKHAQCQQANNPYLAAWTLGNDLAISMTSLPHHCHGSVYWAMIAWICVHDSGNAGNDISGTVSVNRVMYVLLRPGGMPGK